MHIGHPDVRMGVLGFSGVLTPRHPTCRPVHGGSLGLSFQNRNHKIVAPQYRASRPFCPTLVTRRREGLLANCHGAVGPSLCEYPVALPSI